MPWKTFIKHPVVKFLSSIKLAVFVILTLTALMVWGTLAESLYGTEFAKWRVYLSPPFIIVEIFLFLNVLFAAVVRFPYQKRLTGFYITHLGIMLLLIGSAITAISGVDGNVQLRPGKEVQHVLINDPILYAWYSDSKNKISDEALQPLPYKVFRTGWPDKTMLSFRGYSVFVDDYIPYGIPRFTYKDNEPHDPPSMIVRAEFKNPMATQSLELNSLEETGKKTTMGPLTISLDEKLRGDCLKKAFENPQSTSWIMIADEMCLPLASLPEKPMVKNGIRIESLRDSVFDHVRLTLGKRIYDFYPALSDFPVDQNVIVDNTSSKRLIPMKRFFESGPQIIFLGDKRLAYGKEKSWTVVEINSLVPISLPWMGSTITVSEILTNKKPVANWNEELPVGGTDGEANQRWRAARVRVIRELDQKLIKDFWIDNIKTHPIQLEDGISMELAIGRKLIKLPFAISLNEFKMDTNPGTNDPASYESTVTIKNGDQDRVERVYMNNPIREDRYTFYQASYFPLDEGGFGSVLSVNYDPGRFWKYLGSALIVFGSTLYYIMKKRAK